VSTRLRFLWWWCFELWSSGLLYHDWGTYCCNLWGWRWKWWYAATSPSIVI